ncbi:hypothetical protein MKW94_018358 [Papaver nudicaule]|uniref:AAA+ ATPase domain-containing protein n=1 Tax=Papaver nudicaule TaxID=74823 RepID=A0AA41VBR4_PAPNU|nr:hypothetical protein [Papaver nudicaule]
MSSTIQQTWIVPRMKQLGTVMFIAQLIHQFVPKRKQLSTLTFIGQLIYQLVPSKIYIYLAMHARRISELTNPYVDISFDEIICTNYRINHAYAILEAYLNPISLKVANRIQGQLPNKDGKKLVISMDDDEEIMDEFRGMEIWWYSEKETTQDKYYSVRRQLRLKFHRQHREAIMSDYLDHVLTEGKENMRKSRQLRLYSNNPSNGRFSSSSKLWTNGTFDHPVTFDHLAMDPERKKEIVDDLITFRDGKEYYAKVGKPWKRGYLLYGPPGTGKSSMIASMANLLNYDVYDLELTAVEDNSELRRLLQETTDKCIIVIEDIDCSLNLTGKRKKKQEQSTDEDSSDDDQRASSKKKVTLSGLLNFIDGLWSACCKERIIVFTTNHVDKLDPALIRRGRMDKHIEMSYCCFEGFKTLAKNYLNLDSHDLFETIRSLICKVQMTPADVAEHLMPKSANKKSPGDCLNDLIEALEMKLKDMDKPKKNTGNSKGDTKETDDSEKDIGQSEAEAKETDDSMKDIGESKDETKETDDSTKDIEESKAETPAN